jgi:predicted NUDIX family NTP pyrophosphohydrolase
MTRKQSYGIVLYRKRKDGAVELFLCKANGVRYWNSMRVKIWGIPKGRRDKKSESALKVAKREFREETGCKPPKLEYTKLCKFRTPHNKDITVFIADATGVGGIRFRGSNTMTTEYPAGSGEFVTYPEIATARWLTIKQARKWMMYGQVDMLDIIEKHIKKAEKKSLAAAAA